MFHIYNSSVGNIYEISGVVIWISPMFFSLLNENFVYFGQKAVLTDIYGFFMPMGIFKISKKQIFNGSSYVLYVW